MWEGSTIVFKISKKDIKVGPITSVWLISNILLTVNLSQFRFLTKIPVQWIDYRIKLWKQTNGIDLFPN
jgi:hypothetical protein